jgi:hypothetical protein
MSLFDELNIKHKMIDDDVWVNLPDLSDHLLSAVKKFVHGSFEESTVRPIGMIEQAFLRGIAEGMMSVISLLAQSGIEIEFSEKINTVEDLIKTLNKD